MSEFDEYEEFAEIDAEIHAAWHQWNDDRTDKNWRVLAKLLDHVNAGVWRKYHHWGTRLGIADDLDSVRQLAFFRAADTWDATGAPLRFWAGNKARRELQNEMQRVGAADGKLEARWYATARTHKKKTLDAIDDGVSLWSSLVAGMSGDYPDELGEYEADTGEHDVEPDDLDPHPYGGYARHRLSAIGRDIAAHLSVEGELDTQQRRSLAQLALDVGAGETEGDHGVIQYLNQLMDAGVIEDWYGTDDDVIDVVISVLESHARLLLGE